MDRTIKLLLPVLAFQCGLHEIALVAQPYAMPATVISSGSAADSRSVNNIVSTPGLRPLPQSTVWNDEAGPSSGVSQAAYEQDLGPSPQATYAVAPPIVLSSAAPTSPQGLPDPAGIMQAPNCYCDPWSWQLLPDGLIYHDYMADQEEPRFASQNVYDKKLGWLWDVTLGGHIALFRFGTQDPQCPEGWEVDMEGAVFPRLDATRSLVSADYRFALPFTYRAGPWETRFGYSHLSSHLGDIYMEEHPGVQRINYIREQFIFGLGYRPIPDIRLYGEASYAFHYDGGGQPWEFKFGLEYSPSQQTGIHGAPFFAVNGDLREDVDYSGNITGELGWQWRGASGHIFRVGGQYFNGYSDQRQFYHQFENYVGVGIWYDY